MEPLRLPDDLISVSAFVCHQVLKDQDGLVSAIRIFDAITVRRLPVADTAFASFFVVALVKSNASESSKRNMKAELLKPSGEPILLGKHSVLFDSQGPDTQIGATLILELTLAVKESGLHVIRVSLNEEPIAIVPLTLRIETVQVL